MTVANILLFMALCMGVVGISNRSQYRSAEQYPEKEAYLYAAGAGCDRRSGKIR